MSNLVTPSTDSQCDSSNNIKIQTKKDKQMKATLDLKLFGARLIDSKSEVENIYNVLVDSNSTTRAKKSCLLSIKNTILPFLQCAANVCSESAKTLSPIPSLEYVHRGKENKIKQEIKKSVNEEKNNHKSIHLMKLQRVLQVFGHKSFAPVNIIPKMRIKTRNGIKLPTDISNLPPPSNGSQYNPKETIQLLQDYPENSKKKTHLINHLITSNLVPVTKDSVYKLLRRKKALRRIREEWGQIGRNKLLGKPEANKLIKRLKTHTGSVITADDVVQKINETRVREADELGLVPITSRNYKPCRATLDNYLAELANSDGVHIAASVSKKTTSRYTAENSLISSMCLAVLIAATHFIIVQDVNQDVEKMLKQTKNNGVKLMYNLVCKCNKNLPMIPLRPEYVYSSDDTTTYCYEGKGENKASFVLVGSNTMTKSGTRSRYAQEDSNHMCGLRVKLTYTFSAAGISAPIFVSIVGLTEREMPSSQCVSIKIKGLCIGGDGINIGTQQQGTILFMRNDVDKCDIQRYQIYRDEIFLPFVKRSREEFSEWRDGMPIPEHLTAVSWCDGDLAQISNITCKESIELYKANKIIANKQNAARSGTEQAADLTKAFKIMHNLQKTITYVDTPFHSHPMKQKITRAFDELSSSNQLRLPSKKRGALIDFVSGLPQMVTKAVTYPNVIHGFKENGMIDSEFMRFPDFEKILATCRRDPTKEEFNLCINSFPYLYTKMVDDGHLDDSIFEEVGFPSDRNASGEMVRRNATISQESQQRAKWLTHQCQVDLRQSRLDQIDRERNRRKMEEKEDIQSRLRLNVTCEEKLMDYLEKDGKSKCFTNISMEVLERCNVQELQSFILTRSPDMQKSKLPKKGKSNDAQNGERNLIHLAFSLRTKRNRLKDVLNSMCHDVSSDQDNGDTITRKELVVESSRKKLDSKDASEILGNDSWISNVWKCFHTSSTLHHFPTITDSFRERADTLQTKLVHRLHQYLPTRLKDENKRSSWCWSWAERNFGFVAAIMMILGHIKEDFECFDEMFTLLDDESCFQVVEGSAIESNEGTYLYFDKNNKIWIRSGKVSSRSFLVRHSEHEKRAKAKAVVKSASRLYKLYPSRTTERARMSFIRRGLWENLGLFAAIAIDQNDHEKRELITRDYDEGGLFIYNKSEANKIISLKSRSHKSEEEKRIEVIAYLFELAYDLAISYHDNVSESMGFESCIGGC